MDAYHVILLCTNLALIFVVWYAATLVGNRDDKIKRLMMHIKYEEKRHRELNEVLGIKDIFTGEVVLKDE